ncbi:MAG TPA: nuclear transport factor 2 family protein [Candidatus Saccharimonadales bacterium]|jgi:ketosteroid isomerase-like protein|nr:nuclear transport factor 2 family protein [Candidatus Saccharimonadales bacterium]
MPLKVPQPVASYLAAENTKDAEKLALCFAEDAVVHDEGQDHRGRAAIQQWKQEVDTKYRYVLEPLNALVAGDVVRVRTRLTGKFPGSPVEVDHIFKLANDQILRLEIRS